MRVMAFSALASSLVSAIIDARHCASVAIGISQLRMTPEAKLPAAIDMQNLGTAWMIYSGPMTVFALDGRMDRGVIQSNIFFVTLRAGVSALILDRNVLPVLDTAEAVIAVGEIPAMNSEVVRYQNPPTDGD